MGYLPTAAELEAILAWQKAHVFEGTTVRDVFACARALAVVLADASASARASACATSTSPNPRGEPRC